MPETSWKSERIDVAFVRDEVEIRADTSLGRMNEAEVADYIHNPEVLIPGRGFHDLLGRRHLNQRGVFHLGVDRNNVLRMVLNSARRRLLREATAEGKARATPTIKTRERFMRRLLFGWR